jgi:hypothetical protein
MALPLSSLTFYRMADVSPASSDIQGLLDAIYTACSAANDYRATALAATHTWSWNRQVVAVTKAVYATPPGGTGMGLSPGLIWAGDSGAPAPTMASPDTFTASNLLMGIVKNRGAWNDWANAQPFTSGTNSGYWRAAGTTWNSTTAKVRAYISEEVIFLQLIGTTVTQQAWLSSGAIVEPHQTNAASGGLDAETDDRLYGMWATGGSGIMTNAWLNSNATQAPFGHGTTAGACHGMVWQPGTSTLYTGGRKHTMQAGTAVAATTTPAGMFVGDLMAFHRNSGSVSPNGSRMGMLRGIYPSGSFQSGKTIRSGATDLYHCISTDTSAVADGLMLKAAS